MDEERRKQISAGATKSKDIFVLLDRAKRDPQLMQEMIYDLDAVIRKNNMIVDPESDVYKALKIRLYHANNVMKQTVEDLVRDYGDPGLIPDFPFSGDFPSTSYSSLLGDEGVVDPIDLGRPLLRSADIAELKRTILDELRAELRKGSSAQDKE